MKCTVVSIFKDKNDGTVCREGEELELTEKRFKEINSTDAGILVKEVVAETPDGKTPANENPEGAKTGTGGE